MKQIIIFTLLFINCSLFGQRSSCSGGHSLKDSGKEYRMAKRALKERNKIRANKVYPAHCWAYYAKQSNSN